MMHASKIYLTALVAAELAYAHTGAWAPGMYCKGGNDPTQPDNPNNDLPVNPLYMLSQQDFWFQHFQGCDNAPPPAGEFLELPANGNFTVELAHNRGQTTLSFNGQFTSEWPDGQIHPEDWNGWNGTGEGCIQDDGAMHVQNQTSATGTAFAISYESELSQVTLDNLAVFTVLEHTPWKRISTYQVPDLPACPPAGCTCAWLWVPKGCGIPNIYMQGFKCNVTGSTSTTPVAPAVPPVYCASDPTQCVQGAKQMIVWHQAEANNVNPPGGVSPGYNTAWGWPNGAQTDIFGAPVSSQAAVSSSVTSSSISSSSLPSPSLSSSIKASSSVSSIVGASSSTSPQSVAQSSTKLKVVTQSSSSLVSSESSTSASTMSTSFVATSPSASQPVASSPTPGSVIALPANPTEQQVTGFWNAFLQFLALYFNQGESSST